MVNWLALIAFTFPLVMALVVLFGLVALANAVGYRPLDDVAKDID